MFFKFSDNDIFRQTIVANPKYSFLYATDGSDNVQIFLNNPVHTGTADNIRTDATNKVELNVDRTGNQLIYPFVYKTSNNMWLNTVNSSTYNALAIGSIITGTHQTYPLVYRDYINDTDHPVYKSIQNIWNSAKILNPLFDFATNPPLTGAVHIFSRDYYGEGIKKGSVRASVFFVTTDVNNQVFLNKRIAQDIYKDGILRIVEDNGYNITGTAVGYVLYDYGAVLFKSATITSYNPNTIAYNNTPVQANSPFVWSSGSQSNFSWAYFGDDHFVDETNVGAYCSIEFEGTNHIDSLTMMCTAPAGRLNNSTNPSFIEYGQNIALTSTSETVYIENDKLNIKNIVSSSFNVSEPFNKEVYIDSVNIYDENKQLLGVAQLANPLRKKESSAFTIKLVLDL